MVVFREPIAQFCLSHRSPFSLRFLCQRPYGSSVNGPVPYSATDVPGPLTSRSYRPMLFQETLFNYRLRSRQINPRTQAYANRHNAGNNTKITP